MISTSLFPGRSVQGKDAGKRLAAKLSRYGDKRIVVCDPFIHTKMLADFEPCMKDGVQVIIDKFDGECSDEEIKHLLIFAKKAACRVVISAREGGGPLDTAKAVAHEARVAAASCAKGETLYNEPMSVTPDMVFSALEAADAEGRRR